MRLPVLLSLGHSGDCVQNEPILRHRPSPEAIADGIADAIPVNSARSFFRALINTLKRQKAHARARALGDYVTS